MKYAITFRDEGIEDPAFEFETPEEAAEAWFARHAGNTGSLDMMIVGEDGRIYQPVAHQDFPDGPTYGYGLNGPY